MAKSNNTDLDKCYELEETIMAEVHYRWPTKLEDRINKYKNQCWIKKHWSHVGHVGITIGLVTVAALLWWLKTGG